MVSKETSSADLVSEWPIGDKLWISFTETQGGDGDKCALRNNHFDITVETIIYRLNSNG